MKVTANRLGEIRAETDKLMLDKAFLETADYRTVIESSDKIIIIGRRGTGKSALTYKLEHEFLNQKDYVVRLIPDEDQVIGIRPLLKKFSNEYSLVRAVTRIAWEALLCLVVLNKFCKHYKFDKVDETGVAKRIIRDLYDEDRNVAYNLRKLIAKGIASDIDPEEAIAELSEKLNLKKLKGFMDKACDKFNIKVVLLIDSLDEGYIPDDFGIAYIAGIVQGTLSIHSAFETVRPILFLRDNMFRAVAEKDPDYSRNIEGTSLRLHWEEQQLLNLLARRLRVAFNIEQENDIRVWNKVTSGELNGREGFRKCLRLTLYRPRDLLGLLNQAFFIAARNSRDTLICDDVDVTAKTISVTRLQDLQKEYLVIFPAIAIFTSVFMNYKPEFTAVEAEEIIGEVLSKDEFEPKIQQDVLMFDDSETVIRSLYSVGFIGIKDAGSNSFMFCHDGRTPDISIKDETVLMVHPCYQIALNMSRENFEENEVREIHDDYEIEIESTSQEQRNKKIGQMISKLRNIETGNDDASEFEEWCLEAVKTCFAGDLRNFAKHPNKDAPQRRDIVATNYSEKGVWKRILDDFGCRHVIFEVKNYSELKPDDFRQMSSYLNNNYGRLGFIITRSENRDPDRVRDLQWIREIYHNNDKRLIILLSYKLIVKFLEKIRNPQKHDAVDKILEKVLDDYQLVYLNESIVKRKKKKN